MMRSVGTALLLVRSASAGIERYRKPFYVESGAALAPAGAAGFYAGTKCGVANTFTVAQRAGAELRVELVVPATSERQEDDRWSLSIAASSGDPVYRSAPRFCKQGPDDHLDIITLVATRTIHRYPADRVSSNTDWNNTALRDYVVTVTKSCTPLLPNGTLQENGEKPPPWMRDSTWISKEDGVDNYGLWVGDIGSEFLDVGLELTLATPITIERAQWWGQVCMLPWTAIPAIVLCNIILLIQAGIKATKRCRDEDRGDGCIRKCCIWPMDPPLYFWFAINAMSMIIAVIVNRLLIAMIGVSHVSAATVQEVVLIML